MTEITIDYTHCEDQPPQTSNTSNAFTQVSSYNYRLKAGRSANPEPPQYMFVDRSGDSSVKISQQRQCVVQFDVPYDLEHTVLLYYKMTNFFQNHRRYVKSIDSNQLKGDYVSPSTLNGGDCKPITTYGDKAIYPCGLIANSFFNGALLAQTTALITPSS